MAARRDVRHALPVGQGRATLDNKKPVAGGNRFVDSFGPGGAESCLRRHMGDGCLRLLRLGPDLVHKSPLPLETAFRPRRAGATRYTLGRHGSSQKFRLGSLTERSQVNALTGSGDICDWTAFPGWRAELTLGVERPFPPAYPSIDRMDWLKRVAHEILILRVFPVSSPAVPGIEPRSKRPSNWLDHPKVSAGIDSKQCENGQHESRCPNASRRFSWFVAHAGQCTWQRTTWGI